MAYFMTRTSTTIRMSLSLSAFFNPNSARNRVRTPRDAETTPISVQDGYASCDGRFTCQRVFSQHSTAHLCWHASSKQLYGKPQPLFQLAGRSPLTVTVATTTGLEHDEFLMGIQLQESSRPCNQGIHSCGH